MAETTKIEWCHHTFNPWIGCSHVHKGCTNCYAEADQADRRKRVVWGPHGTRSRTSNAYWREPLAWDRAAAKAGERRRVFCASLADVFEDWQGPIIDAKGRRLWTPRGGYVWDEPIPESPQYDFSGCRPLTMADMRESLFYLISQTENLDWLLLTKRPENAPRMWPRKMEDGKPHRLETAWLGYSASDQPTLEHGIGHLLACRDLCPVLFLSLEPLLTEIELLQRCKDGSTRNYLTGQFHGLKCKGVGGTPDFVAETCDPNLPRVSWVIIGGESGDDARPCPLHAVYSLVNECKAAAVPCFVKQLGANLMRIGRCRDCADDGPVCPNDGIACAGLSHPKGGDPAEWPADLRVREFPAAKAVP